MDLEFDDLEFDLSEFMLHTSKILKSELKPFWAAEQTPDGTPWLPRKVNVGKWPLLNHTGLMQRSAFFSSRGNLWVATVEDYGIAQQKIRPWLGIPNSSLKTFERILIDQIK